MNPNLSSANKSINITTNGLTVIPGKLVLVDIIVNTKGGSGNTAQIFDSTAAIGANQDRKKGTLDTVNTLGNVRYNIFMGSGIYIVTGGGTAPDLTIVYAETP